MRNFERLALVLLMTSAKASNAQWIQSGLASDTTTCFAMTDSVLFAGTPGGVFRSSTRLAVTEYLIPRADAFPHDPAVAPDGVAWYTDQYNSYIGKLDPLNGNITDYPTPTPDSGPHGIDVAPDGFVWYTAQSVGRIGRLDPATGSISEYVLPAASNRPHTPLWHGGYIWYTAQTNAAYGRLDPVTGNAAVFSAPAGSLPYGIAAAPDGALWIALFGTNKLGRVDTTSGAMQLFTLPNSAARPRRLAVADNGLVYYTDYARGYLGRLDPATSQVREWLVPDVPPGPYGIAVGTDGRVWFNAQGTSAMFAFDPASEQMDAVTIPTAGAIVRNMACDGQRGVLWLALSGTQRLGRVDLVKRSWVASGLTGTVVNALVASPGAGGSEIMAGTDAGVLRSINAGNTWAPAGNGLPNLAVTSMIADDTHLLAGVLGGGVYVSTDHGGHWSASSGGLSELSVMSLGLVSGVVFAGTQNGVFRSVDHGATWEPASAGLPGQGQYWACAFTGNGASTFAAVSHATGAGGGVYRSTNGGLSWSAATAGLDQNVVALMSDGNALYAGTKGSGVYVSNDNGTRWTPYNTGLSGPALQVRALGMSDGVLAVGTADGVWLRSPAVLTSVQEQERDEPVPSSRSEIYPNPFGRSTVISFVVGSHGHTSLRVFDMLGREVATLVDEVLPPGRHVRTWHAEDAPTGVYFYRLTSGERIQGGRLVRLK